MNEQELCLSIMVCLFYFCSPLSSKLLKVMAYMVSPTPSLLPLTFSFNIKHLEIWPCCWKGRGGTSQSLSLFLLFFQTTPGGSCTWRKPSRTELSERFFWREGSRKRSACASGWAPLPPLAVFIKPPVLHFVLSIGPALTQSAPLPCLVWCSHV